VALHTTILITATQDGDADQNSPKDAIVTFTRDGTPAQALNVYYTMNTNGIFDQPANQYTVPYNPDLSGANLAANLVNYPNNTQIFVATIPAGSDHVDVHYTNYVNANAYLSGIDIEVDLWNDPNADSTTPELYDAPGTSLSPAVVNDPQESFTAKTDPNVLAGQLAQASAKVHDSKLRFNNGSSKPNAPTAAQYDAWIADLSNADPAIRANARTQLLNVCDNYPSIAFGDDLWNNYNSTNSDTARLWLAGTLYNHFPLHVHPIVPETPPSGGPQVWTMTIDAPIWTWFDDHNAWAANPNGAPFSSADVVSWSDVVSFGQDNSTAITFDYWPNGDGDEHGRGNEPSESQTVDIAPVKTGEDRLDIEYIAYDVNDVEMLGQPRLYEELIYYVDKA
jgi:hypothetical protein